MNSRKWWIPVLLLGLILMAIGCQKKPPLVESPPESEEISPQQKFVRHFEQPVVTEATLAARWDSPLDVAVSQGKIYVLDTTNDRVLILNDKGDLTDILGQTSETAFLLNQPQAMALYQDFLYIANTEAGSVEIITLTGEIVKTIRLPQSEKEDEPRPTGIAVTTDGNFYVADLANKRVLYYNSQTDEFLGFLPNKAQGRGSRYRLHGPRGLTLDPLGNLYVADESGYVKKFSSQGRSLGVYSMMSRNPKASWPVAVVVGKDGTVFYSDGKRKIVHALAPAGEYLGIVGLLDPTRLDSPLILDDPWGLYLQDDKLYVIDRKSGLFIFRIEPDFWKK